MPIRRVGRRASLILLLAAVACGSSPRDSAPPAPDGAVATTDSGAPADLDAGSPSDAYDGSDAGFPAIDASALTPCPTTGAGAFAVTGVTCFNATPAAIGATATGENATVPHYAIRPSAAAPATLVLFLVGSGGKPSGVVRTDPTVNLYAAAAAAGRAVLGLAYKNDASLGSLCKRADACYFPSRKSIILGGSEPGSAIDVTPDESVVDRTARALRFLAAGDPGGGWGDFLTTRDPGADPTAAIAWPKILVAGHSQGGGHAAAIAKLFPVARVVQLSSTCDGTTGGAAVSWTNGAAGPWATDPAQFYGFAATSTLAPDGTGDTTCPYHTLNWANLGMLPSRQNDAAALCGATGDTHSASLQCKDNYPAWLQLFQ